jgi:hypothetical protein
MIVSKGKSFTSVTFELASQFGQIETSPFAESDSRAIVILISFTLLCRETTDAE